jgi:hypothetical protein
MLNQFVEGVPYPFVAVGLLDLEIGKLEFDRGACGSKAKEPVVQKIRAGADFSSDLIVPAGYTGKFVRG